MGGETPGIFSILQNIRNMGLRMKPHAYRGVPGAQFRAARPSNPPLHRAYPRLSRTRPGVIGIHGPRGLLQLRMYVLTLAAHPSLVDLDLAKQAVQSRFVAGLK